MSSRCTAAVFERYPAGGGEFTLALALADNAHDDGSHIYPGLEHMATKSRQDVRSVQRHLKTMLATGWLELVKAAKGRGRPAEYRISKEWLKGGNLSPFISVDNSPQKGDIQNIERVTNEAEKGDIQNTPIRTIRTNTPLPPTGGARGCEQNPGEKDTSGFEQCFWSIWPKKVDQQNARRAWDRLAPDAALQGEIAQAIHAWIRSPRWQAEDGRYIPKPSRWLSGQRWRDVPGIAAPPPPPVTAPAQAPALTPEQLKANAAKAAAAAAHARAVLGRGRVVPA